MTAKLIIRDANTDREERIHELTDEVTTVGRSDVNTIMIEDEKASRQHFRIEKDGESYKVVDLGSTNGTEVNGEKVAEARLRPGDRLRIGKIFFTYEGPGEPPVAVEKEAEKEDGPKYVLEVVEGEEAGSSFNLGTEPLTIGRHRNNKVVIKDESASSYHAEIRREPMGWVLSDFGSTNGTRLAPPGGEAFEKVVKAPLPPGARIRIGKTVMAFKNVGRPAGDELQATVVLNEEDGKALRRALPPVPATGSSGGLSLPAAAAVALLVFFGAVYGVVALLGKPPADVADGGGKKNLVPPGPRNNLVSNADFSAGVDDEGRPAGFRIVKQVQQTRVSVTAEAECRAANKIPAENRRGVRVMKNGDGPASALTYVETETSAAVNPDKTYLLAGTLRNNGDGLCGLRITWENGGRRLVEHHATLVGQQEQWKRRGRLLRPPAWAERARVGFFCQGHDGWTDFDELYFGESRKSKSRRAIRHSFAGVTTEFDGDKGGFEVRFGKRKTAAAALLLAAPDRRSVSTFLSALEPQWTPFRAEVRGRLFDFSIQKPRNYLISARGGRNGVAVRFAVDPAPGAASSPRVVFNLLNEAAGGPVELARGKARPTRIPAGEAGKADQVGEAAFNVGGRTQVVLSFTPPVKLAFRPEGARRRVEIAFQREVVVNLSPTSRARQRLLAEIIEKLRKAIEGRKWAETQRLLGETRAKFGGDKKAAAEIVAGEKQLADAWRAALDRLETRKKLVRESADEKTLAAARAVVADLTTEWAGTEYAQKVKDAGAEIEAGYRAVKENILNRQAAAVLARAKSSFRDGTYGIAASFCRNLIKSYPDTPAAKEARKLLPKAEAAYAEQKKLSDITERLMKKCRNFLLADDYAGAIRTVRDDPDFQKYFAKLTYLNKKLTLWEQKSREKGK